MADKCKGCQSFCMRGAQCAGQAPGASTDSNYDSSVESKKGTYPTSWQSWKDIVANESSICDFLTAQSHNDLITYIIDTYNEGNYNCTNISDVIKELSQKSGGIEIISDTITSIGDVAGFDNGNFLAETGKPIEARHYNNFTAPLGLQSNGKTSSITKDPKGEVVVQKNEQGVGPVAGWPGVWATLVSQYDPNSQTHSNSEIITATRYKELYEAANKLKYHPYQCNICNIYEGGQWHEIVKQTADAIGYSIGYSQILWIPGIMVGDKHVIMIRRDCSGFVCACLAVFSMIEAGQQDRVCDQSSSDGFRDGNFPSGYSNVKQYFSFSSSIGTPEPGSIIIKPRPHEDASGHVEIVKEDGVGSFSGGGGGPGGAMMREKSHWDTRCTQKWSYLGGGGGNATMNSGSSTSEGSGSEVDNSTSGGGGMPWDDQKPDWMVNTNGNRNPNKNPSSNQGSSGGSNDKVIRTLTVPSQYGTFETYEQEVWSSEKYHGWKAGTPQRNLRIAAIDNGRMRKGSIFGLINCAIIDDRLLIATRPNIGNIFPVSIGDYLNVYFNDGTMWKCIVGDIKGADAGHSWGHDNGQSVVEIIYWNYNIPHSGNQKKKVTQIDLVGSFYG